MEKDKVPQDDSSTYSNNRKAIYATDENGKIKVVASTGWEVEEAVTKQALNDLQVQAEQAYCEVKRGSKSPLYYYMYAQRMDLQLLSESTGFFKWTIKRDFEPSVFLKIKDRRLSIYSEALGKTREELMSLEEKDYECE
jgi:hypothetical protein